MSSTDLVTQLSDARRELESIYERLENDVDDADKSEQREKMVAILKTIVEITANEDILEKSDIGQTLLKFRKTFKEDALGEETKKVLNKWKADLRGPAAPEAVKKSEGKSQKTARPRSDSSAVEPTQSAKKAKVAESEFEGGVDILPEGRKKIYENFVKMLKIDSEADDMQISFLAECIEGALHNFLSFDTELTAYKQKAMTLVSNLKQNADLRKDLLDGILAPPEFVRLTAKDLAPAHLAAERKQRRELMIKARRADIYDLARQEIQIDNNLSQETEFECRKCKSRRTTHYAMQTRSSDEPMTIFVCCLQCKFRWRC